MGKKSLSPHPFFFLSSYPKLALKPYQGRWSEVFEGGREPQL